MQKSKFSSEQITKILAELAAGISAVELGRKHGVSDKTISNWKKKYSGMVENDVRKMRELADENGKLKRIVANQALDIEGYKILLEKKW